MYEYLISVTVISAMLGLISYLSYPGSSEKNTRFAVSVLLIYTSMLPILTFVSRLAYGGELSFIDEIRQEAENNLPDTEQEYIAVSEEAIKKGISNGKNYSNCKPKRWRGKNHNLRKYVSIPCAQGL